MNSKQVTASSPTFLHSACMPQTVYFADIFFNDTNEQVREYYALCMDGELFAITKEYADERIDECEWKGPFPMPLNPNPEATCSCHPIQSASLGTATA